MKRFISISVLAVLAGWLLLPTVAARLLSCSMQCCRRNTRLSLRHSHCEGMDVEGDSADGAGQPEISSNPVHCPAGCVFKGRSESPVLPGRASVSIPISSRHRKSPLVPPKGAEPKLFTHAGRGPPLSA